MSVFEKLTPSARKAISYAFEEAKILNSKYIGVEHLLLGLFRDERGAIYKTLSDEGVNIEALRYEILKVSGTYVNNSNVSGYTPRALACLDRSYGISLKEGNEMIKCEHIFLAILIDGDSVAVLSLKNQNLDIDELKLKFSKGNIIEKKKNKPSESILEKFAIDLNKLAEDKKLDPVVGRDDEIKRIIQILSRRTKNNPCIIGESGVGKTAIVEGLAIKISEKDVPHAVASKRIYSLNMGLVVAGTKYRGEFEDRFTSIIDELMRRDDAIVFIDEIHSIIGAGGAEGSLDASSILKPALARGVIQLIGATTIKEYTKYIEKDSAFERRFQPVTVREPSMEKTIEILYALKERYEEHHDVDISDDAIIASVELSQRYIQDRYFPDKAVDLIDEASSKLRMDNVVENSDISDMENDLIRIQKSKNTAINELRFEDAAFYRDEERKLIEEIHEEKQKMEGLKITRLLLKRKHVEEVVSQWTGIPILRLSKSDKERLMELEEVIGRRVIGQETAIKIISKSIKRARVGLSNPNRPLGNFIFIGQTGVGKTELSKALAEAVFGDEENLIRFDMSEYMEKHSVSKLIGSPPGYVGFDEEGLLSRKIRKNPYSVVLFDEIEKAHFDIFNVLLQILDEGNFTDSKGRKINFKNSIIIMTSNIGVEKINSGNVTGFLKNSENTSYEETKKILTGEIKKYFKPEFINRIDETIVFNNLTVDDLKKICANQLKNVKERLKKINIDVKFSDEAINFIVQKSFGKEYGARLLKRKITELVEDFITEEIISQRIDSGDEIEIGLVDENIVVLK